MTTTRVIGYEAQPMQQVFHTCPADEVLYGGAAGGGKSEALLQEAITTCLTVPRTRVCVFRRTSSELLELKDRAVDILDRANLATYNAHQDRWMFSNGSWLRFSHLQHLSDVSKHLSQQYSIILFDEGTTFIPQQIEKLRARNRTVVRREEGGWARMLIGSNPGSIGHVWMKDTFVQPKDEHGNDLTHVRIVAYYDFIDREWKAPRQTDEPWVGEAIARREDPNDMVWNPWPPSRWGKPTAYVVWMPELTSDEKHANEERALQGKELIVPRTRAFIPARLSHNKYLYDDPSYHAILLGLPENERKAMLDGDWDIFEGLFFPEFRPARHVIEAHWTPPAHWRKWRSLDWGRRDPLCCLWHAQDPDTQRIVTYREYYVTGKNDREACREILSLTPDWEHIDFTMADPSMWRADGNDDAISHADMYEHEGVLLQKATNDRVTGWSRVRDLLVIDPKTVPQDDPHGGIPYWQVTGNCRNLIKQFQQVIYDEHNKEDLDTQQEEHALDALRYGVMAARTLKQRRRVNLVGLKMRG